eukprot:CAMPEP_0182587128 /NCGR_PEP_ID=MMETSP1324-20130603/64350_1 /TAXON_ID=236786 /ORGANISM="Florenciella sp., Strain RCC1587" /LENGTH=43 /DNA_ID= /DNA_START= /DNA_END= /DNA_ORIENTATION=
MSSSVVADKRNKAVSREGGQGASSMAAAIIASATSRSVALTGR